MLSLEEIGKSVESGTKKALETYTGMINNFAWYVPEFFVQSHIALDLKDKCDYVSLEEKVSDIRYDKGMRGRHPKDKNNRYDIFICSGGKQETRTAIEIKRVSRGWACNKDIEKLKRAIKMGWVDRGIIIAYAIEGEQGKEGEKDEEKIGEWFEKIHRNIEKRCDNMVKLEKSNYSKLDYKGPKKLKRGDDYWDVVWFEMLPKSK